MNSIKFIIRSLTYFKKQNIGVFLATLLSTAVLTGALIVGDSVKYSLKKNVDHRLGNIENVLVTGDRFVTNHLSNTVSQEMNIPVASLLILESIAINPEKETRINNVQIVGIDDHFWKISDVKMPDISSNEIIISENLANKLNITTGEDLLLRVRNKDLVPLSAPFNSENDNSVAIRAKVIAIANDDKLGRFSLRNNQEAPYNVFINREFLADKINLTGYANTLVTNNEVNITDLNSCLDDNITLRDASLKLSHNKSSNYYELTSERIFIDHFISEKISKQNISHQNILTYFVNSISVSNNETPYSFISAVSDDFLQQNISNSGMIINQWLADDLNANIGDTVLVKYYVIGPLRTLKEKSESFVVEYIIPTTNENKFKSLMPDFPGLSDAGNCGDWDAGIPVDLKKIRNKDEEYWDTYKGTPKAFINLNKGKTLWKNNYGYFTNIRFYPEEAQSLIIESKLLSLIVGDELGLRFENVREIGNNAAINGVDFGELFLSLSFFIIISAILLNILIYSLNLQSRNYETRLLSRLGFNNKQIIKLRFLESFITVVVGSFAGGFVGILYNNFILSGLNSIWNDAIHTDMIVIQLDATTIFTGILIGIIISSLSIYFTTTDALKNKRSKITPSTFSAANKKSIVIKILAVMCILGSVFLIVYSLLFSQSPTIMLSAGFLSLVGLISFVNIWLGKYNSTRNDIITDINLSLQNTARNKNRSIAVIALLALGTFTIIITGANRLTFYGDEDQRKSGTGGFRLWVESTIPIQKNLKTEEGRQHYSLESQSLKDVSFIQFQNIVGDDASCLNLNQIQNPQILGVDPILFDSLNAFSFATFFNNASNPWLELKQKLGKDVIPAIADQTVIQWGLMKSVGDTLHYINENGDSINLLLIGGLAPSIFQGNILIFDSLFTQNYPSTGGSKLMLVDVPKNAESDVQELIKNSFVDYGVEITTTSERLRNFYSVTNTYLTIFMILGGLGILIGTIGLGIVIVKNLIDRKNEIAIYSAIGFKKSLIFKVIFKENFILLAIGIIIGIISSTIGILPSFISSSYQISIDFILIILALVIVNGMIWIIIPLTLILKTAPVKDLRNNNQ